MIQTKISAIGNSDGVIIPKALLAELGLQRGDAIGIEADGMGGARIVKLDGTYSRAMTAGAECFDRYPETMAELAR